MKKIICALIIAIVAPFAHADDAPQPRISIFSTSTDWEAVTGLNLNEYRGKISGRSDLIGRGLVLYYLDGFPCYGLGAGVRAWVAPNGTSNDEIRLACVAEPKTINFAWLNASRDADDRTTTGILTCAVKSNGRDFAIDLTKCTRGPDWDDYE